MGLINQAVEDDKLEAHTLEFAKTILANSSLTVAATKASIARLNNHVREQERAIVGYLSSDFRNRMALEP
ncbi:MAG: hypothetical protein C0508_18270 [Cyanobacteria bacterium PR.023]|nr:hypothetical protein [Cyanobacteria bacterium PR.023]